MPEAEPGVDGTDAAPGASPATPDSEQPTLFSTADAPTTEAVVGTTEAAPPDEWDEADAADDAAGSDESAVPLAGEPEPETPETEPETAEPEPEPDSFATGVLEIVSALDEDESTASAATEAPEAADAAEAAVPVVAVGAVGVEPVAPDAVALEAPSAETLAPEVPAEADAPVVTTADDISPEGAEPPQVEAEIAAAPTPEAAPAAAAAETELPRGRVPWWPFAIYLGLWVGGLGYAAYRLLEVPAGQALYEQVLYGYFVLGGLVLTALGPILIPFVWLLARAGLEKSQRGGLFARTAFWGALSTLLGVAMWWITIIALDAARLGSPL